MAAFENIQDQPNVEGPYSFSHHLHVQEKMQFTIMRTNNGKLEALEVGNTTTPLTMNDLFRKSS